MQLFYLQLLLTYSWSSFAYNFSSFAYSWSLFACSGKVRLIRSLRDCKQRSFTVSKKTPTVSKKASPIFWGKEQGKEGQGDAQFLRARAFQELSGMFRSSASLAFPHRKNFAAIPSVSLVLLVHTNSSVKLPCKSQREIALVWALSRPIPYYHQGKVGGRETGLCFARFVFFWTFRGASHDSNPYPNCSRIARYNATKFKNAPSGTPCAMPLEIIT